MTWEDWDRTLAQPRPDDWAERPDGPDRLDFISLEADRHGIPLTRADILQAMTPQARDRWTP